MTRSRALAHAVGAGQTNLPVWLPTLPHEEQSGRFLHRPQQAYPAATVADFCTAVLSDDTQCAFGPGEVEPTEWAG